MRVKIGFKFEVSIEPPVEVPMEVPADQTPKEYVSPYLQRRLRSLEEVLTEQEGRRQTASQNHERAEAVVPFRRAA